MRQVARSAVTGQFVTKEHAAANPETTTVETLDDEQIRTRALELVEQSRLLILEAAVLLSVLLED